MILACQPSRVRLLHSFLLQSDTSFKLQSINQRISCSRIHFTKRTLPKRVCSPFPDEVSPVQVKKEEEEVQEHVLSCCFCNFTNISMESLIEHYKTHVAGVPTTALSCNFMSTSRQTMGRHQADHARGGPFTCSYCPAKFVSCSLVSTHELRHRVKKPFQCYLCPTSFKWKSSLRQHLRVFHCSKPLQCNKCPQKFATSSSLRRHMLLCYNPTY